MFDDVKAPDEAKLSFDERELTDIWRKRFVAAQDARYQNEEKWLRYYRLYRMHHDRVVQSWQSQVFIPLVFFTVQSVLPKILAQLPMPTVFPVGPEDQAGAEKMETAIRWAADRTRLELRIFEQFWSALTYGTGILKVRAGKLEHSRQVMTPEMAPMLGPPAPVIDPETGQPLLDPDGNPVMDPGQPLGEEPTGRLKRMTKVTTSYMGPVAEYLDIFNVYPAPEASDPNDARFIIQRSWMPRDWVNQRVKSGFYRVPDDVTETDFYTADDDPKFKRLTRIGYGGSRSQDRTAMMCQVWECWDRYTNEVTTMLNERWVVRHVSNPNDHGKLPFVRAVDHLIPGEFWGQGECEVLEGIQDAENTMWNARIDELKLALSKMFMVDEQALVDPRDITRLRPGGFVRVNNPNGLPIQNVIAPIDFGSVTTTAYTEAAELERMAEKVSGTSPYTTGSDAPVPSDTATSVALLSEAGNSRLAMKIRVAELGGLTDLVEMYGSVMQQFTPPDMRMRLVTPEGNVTFPEVGPEAIDGAFDYAIQPMSSMMSEQMRRDETMSLLQSGVGLVDEFQQPVANVRALWEDAVREFGKKDVARYVVAPQPPMPALPAGMEGLTGAPSNGQAQAPQEATA